MDDHVFEEHRSLLEGIAYRMCGVLADAQDIVQETYLKWRANERQIADVRAWLVTACSRLALDQLKSARHRRETYVGPWLPEPFLDERATDPAERARIDDTVSVALMVALEKLTPAERAAFLLHDVFAYSFEEIAEIVGRSEPACRKLASRARIKVREGRPRFESTPEAHQRLLETFLEAAHAGDVANLKSLLTEAVEFHADGGGKVKTAPDILRGADTVAQFFLTIWRLQVPTRESIRVESRWFNGGPGLLIFQAGQLVVALSLAIERGVISRLFALRNPEKLGAFLE